VYNKSYTMHIQQKKKYSGALIADLFSYKPCSIIITSP
jgi:hypothetical protein